MKNLQALKQRYGVIGRSESLDRALETALRVAPTELTVLIQGESGVGKEVISKIIHEYSHRKHNNFIAINTGAIPEGTINSELFGHEKGAFTGATSERKGYFESVNKGTIFLDEIGEMPLDTQAYLLRVLESGEYIKVGSSKVLKTDVRVVAATNVDLMRKIKQGKFREDLYYRLNTVPIRLPALHERREDIHLLFRKFANDFSDKYSTDAVTLDEQARALVENYRWPGNIRELRNLVEQLSVLSQDHLITADDLLKLAPQIGKRNLPAQVTAEDNDFAEREILYKFLFDMKGDLNDLKNMFYELVQRNNLEMPSKGSNINRDISQLHRMINEHSDNYKEEPDFYPQDNPARPVIIDDNHNGYSPAEEVEESLSLDEKTKELITKALKKHKGKRKNAAEELGISERTLYRKIKEYGIPI
jgi:transcriptional regulator with PAS, ATPase and Fis domain